MRIKAIPRLDIVKANTEPATSAYIRHKCRAISDLGFKCVIHEPRTAKDLFDTAHRLNGDTDVHAVIIQMPVNLDVPIDKSALYPLIKPWKDVDGLNPVNQGPLSMTEATPYFYPCTAAAVMKLLEHNNISVAGKHVCIIGRSAIVGRPLFQMMLRANATPTLCHSRTENLPSIVSHADLVVVAVGRAKFLKATWIKPGAVVIDIGINERHDSLSGKKMLTGDVDFEEVSRIASAVSPVPGGVGPLTVAMLMQNVLRAFQLQHDT